MNIISTKIPDVLIIEPQAFEDKQDFFYESYNKESFTDKVDIATHFVQDNHSRSWQNVLRGLHYQIQQPQGKLVCTVVGTVFDVAVDIRKSSPTFGQWVSCILSAENKRQFWIPPGFAHGFLVLSEVAEVLYKATDYYAPQHERNLLWNSPELAIAWFDVSPQDEAGQPFKSADIYSTTSRLIGGGVIGT